MRESEINRTWKMWQVYVCTTANFTRNGSARGDGNKFWLMLKLAMIAQLWLYQAGTSDSTDSEQGSCKRVKEEKRGREFNMILLRCYPWKKSAKIAVVQAEPFWEVFSWKSFLVGNWIESRQEATLSLLCTSAAAHPCCSFSPSTTSTCISLHAASGRAGKC